MEVFNKNINLQVKLSVTETAGMSHDMPFSVDDNVPKFCDEYFHAKLCISG